MILGAKVDLRPNHLQVVAQLKDIYDFIEVYYTPNAVVDHNDALATHERWVVHAPHHEDNVNLATKTQQNKLVEKAIVFAGKLGADSVIVHPGFLPESESSKKEEYIKIFLSNLENLKKMCEKNNVELLLENVLTASIENSIKLGSAPEEMKLLLKKNDCGFVLDFAHAYHASVSYKIDYKEFILKFMKLKPKMFHLYDGRFSKEIDRHMVPGQGNLDIPFFASLVGNNRVTLEIKPPTVDNYVSAMRYLKQLESNLRAQ